MTAALEGGEWSAVRPSHNLPPGRPGTHFTGGWVGPRAGLEGRKISYLEINMDYTKGKVIPLQATCGPEGG